MEKGWEQVVATIAILQSGAAYLPIDPELPNERFEFLLRDGDVKLALVQSKVAADLPWPVEVRRICVDEWSGERPPVSEPLGAPKLDDLAYVIYTSGSTGRPKGVMISHRAAVNTIVDIRERFYLKAEDRILGLSSLSFDLSVFDIFGTLWAGATLVIPPETARRDPTKWYDLIWRERVTVWNSVPALMELLVDHAAARADGFNHLKSCASRCSAVTGFRFGCPNVCELWHRHAPRSAWAAPRKRLYGRYSTS